MNAKTILLPIALKIVRMLMLAIGGWLVRKGWIEAQDSDSLTSYAVDLAPGLLAMLPGIAWDLWTWLNKFEFIVRIETALHLPVTGQPSAAAVQQATINTEISTTSPVAMPLSSQSAPPTP